MANRERSALKILLYHFFSSFKWRYNATQLKGKDMFGTKYYEQELRAISNRTRPRRFFVSEDGDFEKEIPAEWDAWLRYRRREPPTVEEVEESYRIAALKKENAAKLEAHYEEIKALSGGDTPDLATSNEKRPFPVYEDYSSEVKKDLGQNRESNTRSLDDK